MLCQQLSPCTLTIYDRFQGHAKEISCFSQNALCNTATLYILTPSCSAGGCASMVYLAKALHVALAVCYVTHFGLLVCNSLIRSRHRRLAFLGLMTLPHIWILCSTQLCSPVARISSFAFAEILCVGSRDNLHNLPPIYHIVVFNQARIINSKAIVHSIAYKLVLSEYISFLSA